jgi:hypothetical protein
MGATARGLASVELLVRQVGPLDPHAQVLVEASCPGSFAASIPIRPSRKPLFLKSEKECRRSAEATPRRISDQLASQEPAPCLWRRVETGAGRAAEPRRDSARTPPFSQTRMGQRENKRPDPPGLGRGWLY